MSTETFQMSLEAAEIYEARFVPALFGEWAPHVVDAAGVRPGHRVLDVACGTGVIARTAADVAGPEGKVVGLDLNDAMLTVARRLRPDIEWRQGDASELPFPNGSFDVVMCQAGLMFIPDEETAVAEMARVAIPGGTVAAQVFSDLESQPAYGPFVEVATCHAGSEARSLLDTYWRLGDPETLAGMFESAGLRGIETRTRMGTAYFDSVNDMVRTEVEGSPLMECISDETYHRILVDTRRALGSFRTEAGMAEIPIEGRIVTGRKP